MIPADLKITPMMEQYLYWKKKYPDCLLLFRMGDFYELFFDDARTASQVLDIVVTSRDPEKKIPMAGVPYHAVNNYTSRLINAGYKLAICDQVSEPDGKTLVQRRVTRILTPGTFLPEDNQEDARLAAVRMVDSDNAVVALLSVGTGELKSGIVPAGTALSLLSSFSPGELLYPSKDKDTIFLLEQNLPWIEILERQKDEFDGKAATRSLKELWKVASLEGYGVRDDSPEAGCASALCRYLEETQFTSAAYIRGIKPLGTSEELLLDRTSQTNLELIEGDFSLYSVLNRCHTSMGKRKLRNWILHPLLDITQIRMRSGAVESFLQDPSCLHRLRSILSSCSDLQRSAARLSLGNGTPRDMAAIRDTLRVLPDCISCLTSESLESWTSRINTMESLFSLLDRSLVDNVPRILHQSPLIKKGYDEELDHWRSLSEDAGVWLDNYLASERERTGLLRLKAGYNKVYGYYLEVTRSDLENIPDDYIRKQTLVGSERFITSELKDFEEKILSSDEKIKTREKILWADLLQEALFFSKELLETGDALGEVDVLASLAQGALIGGYIRPSFTEKERAICIRGGRHPVIERLSTEIPFVPNDVCLSEEKDSIAILTGPNMAGKSTYLRMAALIIIMAQMGSFVPAEACELAIVNRIFTRIGARDELARGNSTFMLEMLETANILHNVTGSSLVILDEIGRGTSTYDGLSIAWSVIEYLHDHCPTRPKVLFATHYHELTKLADIMDSVVNLSMDVEESLEGIRFLHQVVKKPSDRSYGIEVARLAGIPDGVIRRSEELLRGFENPAEAPWKDDKSVPSSSAGAQLQMFDCEKEGILEELSNLEPDRMTPLEALEHLYRLSSRSREVLDS